MKFKPAKKEFSLDDLPETRGKQFLDFFKTRPLLFLQIGLVILLFALPFLLTFLVKYYAILLPASKTMEEVGYLSFYKTTTLVFDLFYGISFFFIFVALAGIGRIIRQWAWGEGIYFWHDFKKGIKQNIKVFSIYWFLFSLCFFLNDLVSFLINNAIVVYIISGLILLLLPLMMMGLSQSLLYTNTFIKVIENSFFYCLKKPLMTLLFFIFGCGVMCLGLIDQIMIQAICYVALFLLILPVLITGWHQVCLSIFDKYTNKEYYPNLYQKGLRGEFLK